MPESNQVSIVIPPEVLTEVDFTAILNPLLGVTSNLEDSKMVSGGEANISILFYYNIVKQAAKYTFV